MAARSRGGRPRSTAGSIVRTIRARVIDALRIECDCRKPGRGMVRQAAGSGSRSISRGRSSSATRRPTSDWRARSARAACSCAPDTAQPSWRAPGGADARRGVRRGGSHGGDVVDSRARPGIRGRPHDAEPSARALPADHRARFQRARVLVVGDLIADEFIYGEVARVSREAPVLILQVRRDGDRRRRRRQRRQQRRRARRPRVDSSASSARDDGGPPAARELPPRRRRRRTSSGARGYRTPVKTRILAGGVHSAKQQVVRIDREPAGRSIGAVSARASKPRSAARSTRCDAVLLSDYGSGLVTPALAGATPRAVARRDAARGRSRCSSIRATARSTTAA